MKKKSPDARVFEFDRINVFAVFTLLSNQRNLHINFQFVNNLWIIIRNGIKFEILNRVINNDVKNN